MRRTTSRWGRVATLVAAGAVAAIAVGALASMSLGGQPEPEPPALGSNAALLLDDLGPAVRLSPAELVALTGFDEIDTASARLAAELDGARFYVAASHRGQSRFCAFAISPGSDPGPRSTFTCLRRADLGSGAAAVSLQRGAGGLEQPRVYFGLVPEGVARVEVEGRSVDVSDNAYAIASPRGDTVGAFNFRRSDGVSVSVPVFGPGPA